MGKMSSDVSLFRKQVGDFCGVLKQRSLEPAGVDKDFVDKSAAKVDEINHEAQVLQEVDTSDLEQCLIKERAKAIQQICEDVKAINDIMKMLAQMVHEQGEVIDTIEANVAEAAVNTKKGLRELAKARRAQTQNTFKRFFAFVGLVAASAFYVSCAFTASLTSPPMIVLGVCVGLLALYNLYLYVVSWPDKDAETALEETDPEPFKHRTAEEDVRSAGFGVM